MNSPVQVFSRRQPAGLGGPQHPLLVAHRGAWRSAAADVEQLRTLGEGV